jgi:hypothetical protein
MEPLMLLTMDLRIAVLVVEVGVEILQELLPVLVALVL